MNKLITVTYKEPHNLAANSVESEVSRDSKWVATTGKVPYISQVDLRRYYTINEIRLHDVILKEEKTLNERNQAAGFWSITKLQFWDGVNWYDSQKTEVTENRLAARIFKFDPIIATSRIRMLSDDEEPINVMELEVLGNEAPNMSSPPYFISGIKKQIVSTETKRMVSQ